MGVHASGPHVASIPAPVVLLYCSSVLCQHCNGWWQMLAAINWWVILSTCMLSASPVGANMYIKNFTLDTLTQVHTYVYSRPSCCPSAYFSPSRPLLMWSSHLLLPMSLSSGNFSFNTKWMTRDTTCSSPLPLTFKTTLNEAVVQALAIFRWHLHAEWAQPWSKLELLPLQSADPKGLSYGL